MTITIGTAAPNFEAKDEQDNQITLEMYRGKRVVLYFYPKDSTPGCTTEACDFRDHISRLNILNAVVLGVSKDSAKSHVNFKTKYQLNFPLLVDSQETICKAYEVIREKSMYGKTYLGIERSTFLIDEQGKIKNIWRGVKVNGHIDEIIAALES